MTVYNTDDFVDLAPIFRSSRTCRSEGYHSRLLVGVTKWVDYKDAHKTVEAGLRGGTRVHIAVRCRYFECKGNVLRGKCLYGSISIVPYSLSPLFGAA